MSIVDRVTLNLDDRERENLERAEKLSRRKRNETINRAIELYADLLEATQEREKARKGVVVVYLTDPNDPDSTERVVYT